MSEVALTLVGDPLCPFVQRVAIVLREKEVAFTTSHVDVGAKPAWLLALSPTGKVPLLRVETAERGGAVLFESLPICEYLEETNAGAPLHPADPLERARHRAWLDHGTATLAAAWGVLSARDAAASEAGIAALRTRLERWEEALRDGPFFAGAAFSMVDAIMAPVFRYFDVLGASAPDAMIAALPKVSAWRLALAGRASVRAAVVSDYPERLRAYVAELRNRVR